LRRPGTIRVVAIMKPWKNVLPALSDHRPLAGMTN